MAPESEILRAMTGIPVPNPPTSDNSSTGEPPRSDQPSWQPAPPAAAPPHAVPHLRRSTTNRVLGGVCGGLAQYTGTDPLLWRVGFIALAVMGAGVLIYPLLWLLLPDDSPTNSAAPGLHDTLRNGRFPRS
jgi:phage shock protein PspC (stress-responsive transcriptional regulator)